MTVDFKRGSFFMQLIDTARVPIPGTKRRVSLNDESFEFDLRECKSRVIAGVRIACGKNCDPHLAGRHFDTRLPYGSFMYVGPETFVHVSFEDREAGQPLLFT